MKVYLVVYKHKHGEDYSTFSLLENAIKRVDEIRKSEDFIEETEYVEWIECDLE